MKAWLLMRIHSVFLFSILILASPVVADEITIVADEWVPYTGNPDSMRPGYGVEIARCVFESAGHRVSLKYSLGLEQLRIHGPENITPLLERI